MLDLYRLCINLNGIVALLVLGLVLAVRYHRVKKDMVVVLCQCAGRRSRDDRGICFSIYVFFAPFFRSSSVVFDGLLHPFT